eukprot:Gb_29551 [translate_table: standard]
MRARALIYSPYLLSGAEGRAWGMGQGGDERAQDREGCGEGRRGAGRGGRRGRAGEERREGALGGERLHARGGGRKGAWNGRISETHNEDFGKHRTALNPSLTLYESLVGESMVQLFSGHPFEVRVIRNTFRLEIPLINNKERGEEMKCDFIKMFRQRSANYRHLLEFRRRIAPRTCFLLFVVLLVLLFFVRPRPGGVWHEQGGLSLWEEHRATVKFVFGAQPNTSNPPPPPAVKQLPQPPKKKPGVATQTPKPLLPSHTKAAIPSVSPPTGKPDSEFAGNKRGHANCSLSNGCSSSKPKPPNIAPESKPSCPNYFRWIHEDLKPWKKSGITLEMVERAKRTASFRLIIVDGRMYIKTYRKSFQTRDVFTLWGLVQLMEYYPGMLPDLDLMFDCVDWPVVKARDYNEANPPPPLFRYCGDDTSLDIVFPDWSFWGWAEISIRPWDGLLNDIYVGTQKLKWEDRDPTAYWKGNPFVAPEREDLLKCNVSETQDWNARVYIQDWFKESQQGYKESKLSEQCNHRYKIYVEGSAWSVSLKNILACDSPTLMLKPKYYDFFSRGLLPRVHYWPVRPDRKCESIKFAVDWGNNHTSQAKAIGKAASNLIRNELQMSNVYDYMFHLLTEYSKLLKYKPTVPKKAKEYCSQSMLRSTKNKAEKDYMEESMVKTASSSGPCNLVSVGAVEHQFFKDWDEKKAKSIKMVEYMEQKAWRQKPKTV